jgi:dynactin-6
MASRPPTTKRSTATPYTLPVERPPCTIDPTAVVADKATIIGTYPVEIAEHAIIHPYARIRAEGGLPEGERGDVVLDRHVSVESGAEVLARHVGEVTEVGVHARIEAGAVVGRFCRLTPTKVVRAREEVEDFTVVFGEGQRRRDRTLVGSEEIQKQRVRAQEKHVEMLKKLVVDGKSKWIE